MKKQRYYPNKGNIVLFLTFVGMLAISLTVSAFAGKTIIREVHTIEIIEQIPTTDIEFSRCSCDNAIYCLTDEQYTVIMMQLAARIESGAMKSDLPWTMPGNLP
tara:strand:- start:1789 stop:2100 length:312 start_codon:yes stop_codon:yes gene_type:complete